MAFGGWEVSRAALTGDVLIDELPGPFDTSRDFCLCHEVAFINAQHDRTNAGLPHVADGTQNGILEGRSGSGKITV